MAQQKTKSVTPIVDLGGITFKREDLNPSGSVKDRAMRVQLESLKKRGGKKAAISSSGNAAISAAFWGKKMDIQITAFVSPKINKKKLSQLKKIKPAIKSSKKPISDCFKYCRANNAYNLRQSLDPEARKGYAQLGEEIYRQLGIPEAIFFPVSSGATLLGVTDFFKKKGRLPKIFAVQPASHPPLASKFDKDFIPEKEHLTDAIVAKHLPLKKEIISLIKKSGGSGVVVQNNDIIVAAKWLATKKTATCLEGALTLAGFRKIGKRLRINQPLCLLTGKDYG